MTKYIILTFIFIWSFTNVLKSQDLNGSSYFTLGSNSMQDKNYEDALTYFKLAIEQNEPNTKNATIEAGICCKILGNYKAAITFGKKALKYELTNYEKGRIYWLIGNSYGFMEDFNSAFKYFKLMKFTSDFYDIPVEFIFVKEGWYFLAQLDRDYIYYNKNRVKKIGNGKFKFWFKRYWDEKTMSEEDWKKIFEYGNDEQAVERRINEIKSERKYVSYSLTYEEYDLNNNRSRFLEAIDYDNKGNVIQQYNWENSSTSSWTNIVPGSVGELIYESLRSKFIK